MHFLRLGTLFNFGSFNNTLSNAKDSLHLQDGPEWIRYNADTNTHPNVSVEVLTVLNVRTAVCCDTIPRSFVASDK